MRRSVYSLVKSSTNQRFVRITTTGSTFTPAVELTSGSLAIVKWTVEETGVVTTGINPNINFGSAATRHVRLSVTGGRGLADVVTFNMGFDHTQDAGLYNIGATYDRAADTGITAIQNVNTLSGLLRFLAANGNLTGPLDFTGCSALQYIECFGAYVSSVALTGCTSLIRLCLEHNSLTSLNLTPIVANLYDLRAANQRSGSLALTASGTFTHLYHFCTRDQAVTGMPSASQMPVLVQEWIWNTQQTGTLTVTSSAIQSLLAYSNSYSAIDITGRTTLGAIDLHGCLGIGRTGVDAVLAEVDSWNTSNGGLDLSSIISPSATGLTHVTALQARGWTVTVDAATGGVNYDDFNRADATGIANVGNGWYSMLTGDANIVSQSLVYTTATGYHGIVNHGDSLPADYAVTASIPQATRGTYFGLVGRWNGTNGVRMLFTTSATTLTIGDASGFSTNNVTVNTDAGYPASWSLSQDHTITMKMTGSLIEIFLDGQTTRGFYATVTTNSTLANSSYGICGEGKSRAWYAIGTDQP